MKAREVEDAWRRVSEPIYPLRLLNFRFAGVGGFRDGQIQFRSGVNVVCGGNGVGKSTLLQCLYGLLSRVGSPQDVIRINAKGANAVLEAVLEIGGAEVRARTDAGVISAALSEENKVKLPVYFVDVAAEVIRLREKLICTDNLDEALEQVETAEHIGDDLARIAYLVGRSYTKIEVAEIDLGATFEEVPFFTVISGGTTYDSRDMGLGEFTIMYLLWRLERMKKLSIALIEEPEAFMSPLSQLRFANVLAAISAKSKIWFVTSTHSPALVTQTAEQRSSVGLLQHAAVGGEVVEGPRLSGMLRSLGMVPNKRFFVMSEDASSARFLRFLLANENIEIIDEAQFVTCGGDGDVVALAQRWINCRGFTLGAVFLLDGDMRATKPNWPNETRLFLPGQHSADSLVKETILSDPNVFAETVARRAQDVVRLIAELHGVDIHDWPARFAERLGMSMDAVFSSVFTIWIRMEGNRAVASTFVQEFKAALTASERTIEVVRV